MSKSDLNHYSYTPGYQPSKTAESGTLNPPKGETGLPLPPEFFHNISVQLDKPSDIELRIRKEVMALISKFEDRLQDECEHYRDYYGYSCGHSEDRVTEFSAIKDRLNLLWGE